MAPHHVYLCGAHLQPEFHQGDWMQGFSVTALPDCISCVSIEHLLEAAVMVEDDPGTGKIHEGVVYNLLNREAHEKDG